MQNVDVVALERLLESEQLVQEAAEHPNVARETVLLRGAGLWRVVVGGARLALQQLLAGVQLLGDAEVTHFQLEVAQTSPFVVTKTFVILMSR